MNEDDIKNLHELAGSFRRLNNKIKLLSLLGQAQYEYDKNQFENCASSCKKILESEPQNAVALRGLGCIMQAAGDYEKACKYYKQALKNSEHKEIEYTLIGTLYYLEDKLEEAIHYYNKAIEINDNYESAYEGRNQAMLENHLQILDLQDSLIKQEVFRKHKRD